MSRGYSPLRYPGGKAKLYDLVKKILIDNNLIGCTYVEPFAGGAGLAIKLLLKNDVKRIILNDIDPAIYCFWKTILNQTDDFCRYIDQTELTVGEWKKQHEIFKKGNCGNEFEFAFSVFYLNRTNISGILNGGIIGGVEQKGEYKIDARFCKENLKQRIRDIVVRKNDIILYNIDAKELVDGNYLKKYRNIFINFDPPYVNKGAQLYKNSFKKEDHIALFNCIKKCTKKWIVTYDVCDFISKLYIEYRKQLIPVNYSVKNKIRSYEYMFFSKNINTIDQMIGGGNCMKCTDKCRFCSILEGEKVFDVIDTPILEDEGFYLMSSVGAMIEGWSLVIPKKHEYSMKGYYSDLKFYEFINNCIAIVKRAYHVDKVIVFEHGANKFGSKTACGTNHCHIHIVPMLDSILDDITSCLSFQKISFNEVGEFVADSEYLLYADVIDEIEMSDCYIHILKEPVSQFFRRVIATKLGCPNKYNYRENNNMEISKATFITLQKEVENGK